MKKTSISPASSTSRLHELLEELGGRFLDPDYQRIDEEIVEAQKALVMKMGVDRSSLWQAKGPKGEFVLTHIWQKPGWPIVPLGIVARMNLPWALQQVLSGRGFHFTRLSDLPPEAEQDRESFSKYGPRSNVTAPLIADGEVFGALAFARLEKEHRWTKKELAEIRLVAGVFARILGQIRVRERLGELEEEMLRRSRLSLLGEVSATLVHEISQPLCAIRSEAAALRMGCPEEELEAVHAIEDSAAKASQILSNLRAWLRNTGAVREDCQFASLLEEVVGMLQPNLHARGIGLDRAWELDLPAVRVVAVEVRQVLANLLLNAAEALNAKSGERKIRVSARRKGRRLLVRVEDNGPGIPIGMEEQIFAPLFTTRAEGTGMGLAICRRFVERHGGKITAGRCRGGGARFEFSLPVANVQ